jgi:hypothetical protein
VGGGRDRAANRRCVNNVVAAAGLRAVACDLLPITVAIATVIGSKLSGAYLVRVAVSGQGELKNFLTSSVRSA